MYVVLIVILFSGHGQSRLYSIDFASEPSCERARQVVNQMAGGKGVATACVLK